MTELASLGSGGEFDLIRELLRVRGSAFPDTVEVGPGDDAAVLDTGGGARMVLTCDMAVEGVHFRRDWLSPREIGYRTAAGALSDLAAMAAEAHVVLVAGAFADGDRTGVARSVHEGVEEACAGVGAAVVGGDLTRSPGPMVLDVTAVGRLGPGEDPVLRSGARPGDELWVTGVLGGAASAVRLLREGAPVPAEIRAAYAHPVPRIREARWLSRRLPLHALVDLSDGLAGDAGHIAAASGVTVVLEAGRVPVADAPDAPGAPGAGLAGALHGGDDYELCFAAPAGSTAEVVEAFREAFSLRLTRVGRVEEAEGGGDGGAPPRVLLDEGKGPRRLSRGGWDHFGGGGGGGG